MNKFNRLFNTDTTKVKITGQDGWYRVKEIHESRQWIEVVGLGGSFQRNHIETFTNKENKTMKYTVRNVYGISGLTTHRKPETGLKAASKREGEGWAVYDEDGNQWDRDFDGNPQIVKRGDE